MAYQPFHHTVVATDIVASSGHDDHIQLRMRADLSRLLGETLAAQGLELAAAEPTDLGDGFRMHFPAAVSPVAMLQPFVPNLARFLRLHNKTASDATRLRLRTVVHMGLVHREPDGGWAGGVLVDCARMLDAPAARDLIAAASADLVVVVSQEVYDSVVRPGYALDPDAFQPIPIKVKRTDTLAWAHLPGLARPAAEQPGTDRPASEQPGTDQPAAEQPGTGQPAAKPSASEAAAARPAAVPGPAGTPTPEGVPGVRLGRASAVILSGDHNRFHGPISGGDHHAR